MFLRFGKVGVLSAAAAAILSVAAGAALAQENRHTTVGLSAALVGTQLSVGQGTYTLPAVPVASERPYALTGPRTGDDRAAAHMQGRWIDVGQGRVYMPAQ